MKLQQNMKQGTASLKTQSASHRTNTFKEGWTSDWANDLAYLLASAENAEQSLSYLTPCKSEAARKETGSYYTPADVSLFFWQEFFSVNNISDRQQIDEFWREHHFIEPAAGAGALIFALFAKAGELGLSPSLIARTDLTVVDINQSALNFVRAQLDWLATKWDISFSNIRYVCSDFRVCTLPVSPRTPMFFGNPPFVSNAKGSVWKNLFADFVERSVLLAGAEGKCHYIVPLSVAFSRDYLRLRSLLRESGKSIAMSSFDNIPDTLFESGKPSHTNTNKANSQRCSILTVFPDTTKRILASRMHRWKKKERSHLLTNAPTYHDVSTYKFDDQFPRPENAAILDYISEAHDAPRLKALLSPRAPYNLYVAAVARNFIGIRNEPGPSVHTLSFQTKKSFHAALLILTSDLFMNYWRTIGDGFHVTKGNIHEFPIHPDLMDAAETNSHFSRRMWSQRDKFCKTKRHPGGMTVSFDFSSKSNPQLW